jgi:hypothetical protein
VEVPEKRKGPVNLFVHTLRSQLGVRREASDAQVPASGSRHFFSGRRSRSRMRSTRATILPCFIRTQTTIEILKEPRRRDPSHRRAPSSRPSRDRAATSIRGRLRFLSGGDVVALGVRSLGGHRTRRLRVPSRSNGESAHFPRRREGHGLEVFGRRAPPSGFSSSRQAHSRR